MRTFKNPANGYKESIDMAASFGVFFFGVIYLLIRGLWAHVLIWLLVVAVPGIMSGGILLVLCLPAASIAYAFFIQDIIASRYLRQGWVEVSA